MHDDTPLDQLIPRLAAAAGAAMSRWPLPAGARLRLMNVSENVTFAVETDRPVAALRLHRPGYHSRRAIECELAWMSALGREEGVETPAPLPGRDGAILQRLAAPGLPPRWMAMFAFIDGEAPSETGDLAPAFRQLGAIAARAHLHAMRWRRPEPFERLTWDERTILDPGATWGDWRAAPNLRAPDRETLEAVERRLRARLAAYGKGPGRYGLIHGDMRLANLIMTDGAPRLIDFDDSGFGWFMYDFAAAVSFIEDDPQVPALKGAWLAGYRTVRTLPAADEAAIDDMVMLRRLALLAWIGSHIEAPEPQALAPDFARVSAALGRAWLARA